MTNNRAVRRRTARIARAYLFALDVGLQGFFSLVLLRFFLFRDDRAERLAVNSGQSGGSRQKVMVLVRVPVFCGA